MVHVVTVTILTKVVISLCILGYNCHWCYGLVTNVVPGHGVQNPNYMSTYTTDNYEFCLYLCMATWECEMAVVTQQDGLKSCHLSADLVPPSQLKPNDEEVAIYQETEGTLIGDTFYFLSTPASKPGAVHDCNYRFDANVLSVANPKETREALDYVLYSGATDIWLSLIQRNSGLVWFFMEKENNITLNYDGIDLTYQSTDECFRYVYNGDGLWSIQPGGCNDIHQVICQRKIQGNSFNQWTQGGGLPTTTSAVTTTEATTTPTTTTEATTTPTTTTEATTTTTEATTRTTTRTGLVPGIVNPLLG